jgi:hypothetical protein
MWFILIDGQVTGPFEPTDIESKITGDDSSQIWGRGYSEWMTPPKWRIALKETPAPASMDAEVQPLWKIRVDGQEKLPLRYADMIALLKTIKDVSSVDIFSDKNGYWQEVYSFPQVADALGISRRAHPRVPIVGTLQCESPKGDFSCRVISISEGGIGINDAKDLVIGDRFKGTLTSPNLYTTINATCEVVYVGGDGYAGLRFATIPTEFKSSIIEYVNKFATE